MVLLDALRAAGDLAQGRSRHPGLPRLRPRAVRAMRSELSPTRSHRRPELSQLQSRAWPCAVHSRPGATGGGPQPRLQGGLGRGLSTPRASSIGLPGGAAQTAAAVKVPRTLSHTGRVTEPRPGRVCTPHWVDRPCLHKPKCTPSPPRLAL